MRLLPLDPAGPARTLSRRACVVDPRLVLSPFGLAVVDRLSGVFDVWLPAALREVLREPAAFSGQPEALLPLPLATAGEARLLREVLAVWEGPRPPDPTGWPAFFIGDRVDESSLPAGLGGELRSRYFALAEPLDAAIAEAAYDLPRGQTVSDGVRDAAALAGALFALRAFILSPLEPGPRAPPVLCHYLAAWRLAVEEVPEHGGAAAAGLRADLAAAELGPLVWSGVELAAVHVVIPTRRRSAALPGNPWHEARIFWHRL